MSLISGRLPTNIIMVACRMKAVAAVLLALGSVLVAGAPVPAGEEGQAPALNTLQPLDEQRLASADTTAAPGKPSREAEFSTTESGRLLAVLAGIINEMRNDACGPLGPITIDDQQSIEVNKRVDGADSVTHEFTAVFSMNETIHEKAADGTIRKTHVKRNGLTVDAAISEMVDEEHEGKGDGFMTVGRAPKPLRLLCTHLQCPLSLFTRAAAARIGSPC